MSTNRLIKAELYIELDLPYKEDYSEEELIKILKLRITGNITCAESDFLFGNIVRVIGGNLDTIGELK